MGWKVQWQRKCELNQYMLLKSLKSFVNIKLVTKRIQTVICVSSTDLHKLLSVHWRVQKEVGACAQNETIISNLPPSRWSTPPSR